MSVATIRVSQQTTATNDPEQVAVRAARASGHEVAVAGSETATSTVLAEPDGSMRAVFTAVPTRVQRGGAWVPIDTDLRRGISGRLMPAAVESPLTFSSGGATAPLVRLGDRARSVELWWPGSLPTPRVSGSSATYPDVMSGVDARLTATEAGFTLVLVVRDRAAGLRLLASPPRLRIVSPGLSVLTDGAGGLVAVDESGTPVFTAPTALMWDATAGTHPGQQDRTAQVGLTLAGSMLALSLDRAMVADPGTRYPLYVDPSFTASTLNWTDPLAQSPNVSFWNGQNLTDPTDPNGPIMVGLDPMFGTDARALFQMNTSPINGKHILGATFRITEGWANSCTASDVDLWLTGAISSSTTWANQPSWTTKEASVNAAHRLGDSSCGQAQVAFNATGAVQTAAADGWPNLTLGLRAGNEGVVDGWKRFQKDATLQVDYNSISTVGALSTIPATTCVSGGSSPAADDPVLNSPTPTLIAVANDADTAENSLKGNFVWQSWNGSAWVASGSGNDPIGRAANTQTSFTLPSGSLTDGTTYRWQVRIADPLMSPYSGTDFSAWSAWCEFVADFTPPAAPAVSSTVYPSGCAPCGGVGTTGTFTLSDTSSDVTSYTYGFRDPPTVTLTPASQGGPVSFNWTPGTGGPTTLFVEAKDAGGNISAETRYSFTVASPAPLAAQWLLQDLPGSTTLTDTSGNNHPAALTGGTLGADSRIVGIGALSLNGTSDSAATSGPVVDTSKSFSVSAWVELTDTSISRAAVGEQGASGPAFRLQYASTCACLAFQMGQADTPNPALWQVTGPAPVLDRWTHVVGVYDAGTATLSLYVNGVLAATAAGPAAGAGWTPVGPLTIGRGIAGGSPANFWAGSLSQVQVWPRVLYATEVQALVDPTSLALVEANSFENPGGAGTIERALPDPLNLAHDLVLQGTAQVPPAGAGYQGLGLQLDGNGFADSSIDTSSNGTPNQVLHTDQSFTVSAWVRLTGSALPTRPMTAVSQLGTNTSGFFLGYRGGTSGGTWSFAMPGADTNTSTGWTEAQSAALTSAAMNTWTELTGVYDVGAGTLTLFVDGQQAARVARASAAVPWDAKGNLTVGEALWSPTGGPPSVVDQWVGDIDELRAYQGILVTPAGSWQFGGCTGTPATCPDSGSSGHPLTLSSSGASIVNVALPSTQPGPALSLDGTAGVATTSGPVIDTSTSFTVGAWVQMPTLPTAGTHVIVSQAGTHQDAFEVQYNGASGALCYVAWTGDSTSAGSSQVCAPNATAGQWVFVAGVYDGVNGTISLYTAGPGGSPSLAGSTGFTSPWKSTGALRVGAGYGGGITGYLGGDVTDMQVYPGVIGDLGALT
jgi:hypothetical protein